MTMLDHSLTLTHSRQPAPGPLRKPAAASRVEVDAASDDLTECWSELLSRLPPDVYAALEAAMGVES